MESGKDGRSRSKALAIAVYTLARVALFVAVYFVIELLTPLRSLWAAAAALLISGAISLVLLDRQRDAVGLAAAGFFHRINERIEASARAEDDDDDAPAPAIAPTDASEPEGSASGDGEGRAENQAVDQQ